MATESAHADTLRLRPLGTLETIDAAVEIARRDVGLYGGLALLSLGPLVVFVLRFLMEAQRVHLGLAARAGHALLLTLALLWRAVVMGAASLAVAEYLGGGKPRLSACLRQALPRGVSLATTGAAVALFNIVGAVFFFSNVWLAWVSMCAIPLCAERSASALGSFSASHRLLRSLGGKCVAISVALLMILALTLLNLTLGTHLALLLVRTLFDVDV